MSSSVREGASPVRSPATANARAAFRPDIEGLRAIAILLVVGFHAGVPGFSGGYVGVDIFFVLSGFLITGLLVREIEESGTIDLPRFYARRARRLLPALALTLLVTVIVSAAIYPPFEVKEGGLGATAFATAAYASNLYFAKSATDYFGPDREKNPLLHTWSLSVEEQFYLVWPVFVMFALSVFSWQSRRNINHRRLLRWMTGAMVLSFALSLYLTSHVQPWAYFTSPTRAWEFALGAIIVLLPQKDGKARSAIGWIGLAGIGLATIAFGRTTVFPGTAVLLPALATAMVLRAATDAPGGSMVRMLSAKPLQKIGGLSYSWYLWHWPVIVFGTAIIAEPSLTIRVALAVASYGIAMVSYHFLENPIRHNRRLASRNAYSLAMAAALAVLGISVSLAWRQASIWAADNPTQARFTRARRDEPSPLSQNNCFQNYFDVEVVACNFAVETSTIPIVLLGDSHAAQWFSAFEPIAAKRGWRLVTMMKSACAMVDAPFFYSPLGRTYTECGVWRKNALAKIRQIGPLVTVVASSEGYTFQDDELRDGISRVVQQLAEASQNVLILRDAPRPDFDIPTCLARRSWRPAFIPSPACEFPLPGESKVFDFQGLAARDHKNVTLVDLSSNICPGGVCRAERDDLILYRDSNHLTASFVKSMEKELSDQISEVVAQSRIDHPLITTNLPTR